MYKHPGVYIEHVPSGVLVVEAASTSITAFIGAPQRGDRVTATAGEPVFITSVSQYATLFGPLPAPAGGVRNLGQNADAFGLAISSFFANGGAKAYVVPVGASDGTASSATAALAEGDVALAATSGGTWADGVVARFTSPIAGEYTMTLGKIVKNPDGTDKTEKAMASDDTEIDLPVLDVFEVHTGLVLDAASGQYIEARVNGASNIVTVDFTAGANAGVVLPLDATLGTGAQQTAPTDSDYQAALDRLKDYRDISIIVLPGQIWSGNAKLAIERAITHAEFMQNRMVIVDPINPATPAEHLVTPTDVRDEGFPTSPYTALYYPWLTVPNAFYDPDTAANLPKTFAIAPSAMAAGMWGRIDATRGVWKAPAGLEATVRGSLGPNVLVGNAIQDNLNEWGVNCIRAIIGPPVVWGARTLATKSKPEFRYVPVRRTQSMIGESLYAALQAVVFEPNNYKLWGSLRASVGNFMDQLHRAGAFQGEKASDAYYVRCGLGSTMTQADIDSGIVRVVVGFAPLKPAEFVVVQIQQIVGQTA
jgi:uncharacterized protein